MHWFSYLLMYCIKYLMHSVVFDKNNKNGSVPRSGLKKCHTKLYIRISVQKRFFDIAYNFLYHQ